MISNSPLFTCPGFLSSLICKGRHKFTSHSFLHPNSLGWWCYCGGTAGDHGFHYWMPSIYRDILRAIHFDNSPTDTVLTILQLWKLKLWKFKSCKLGNENTGIWTQLCLFPKLTFLLLKRMKRGIRLGGSFPIYHLGTCICVSASSLVLRFYSGVFEVR